MPYRRSEGPNMQKIFSVWVLLGLVLSGCAFGGYARADLQKNRPSFATGTTKAQIVEMLGPPDKYIQIDNTEYLSYRTKKGWFVILYGETEANEYEIKLTDGQFASARLVSAGSSYGIFAPQGAVAE